MSTALPSRCVVCHTAIAGPGSLLPRMAGIQRSRHNPNLCSRCQTHIGDKQTAEISTVFVDLAGFTSLTQEHGPEKASEIVQAFLKQATEVLVGYDALIDKYIGDSVMAIFNVPLPHPDHARLASAAALEIQSKMPALRRRFGLNLRAKISVATGVAHISTNGSGDGTEPTAIGDVVNLAARLEQEAKGGEVLLHGRVYDQVGSDVSGQVKEELLTLKGFADPVRAYRLDADTTEGAAVSRRDPYRESRMRLGRQGSYGFGSTLFSLLGAPCAAGAALGPLALAIGAGSLFAQIQSGLLHSLDLPYIRLPLQVLAIIGLSANLYALWHAGQLRKKARAAGRKASMTWAEIRRTWLVALISALTLVGLAAELYEHVIVGHMPLM